MNTIHALSTYDANKTEQYIKLKIEYEIALLNLFPSVLECIIHDYCHDIIEVKLICKNEITYTIDIINQSVNYKSISHTCYYFAPKNEPFKMETYINNLKRVLKK